MKITKAATGIVVSCPHCKKRIHLTPGKDGKKIQEVTDRFSGEYYLRCLNCNEEFEMPQWAAAAVMTECIGML